MAIETQSTTLSIDNQAIGEVVDFSGPGGSASVIDATHLGSTAKEKLMGLPDEGQFTFNLNLDPQDAGQEDLRDARLARSKNSYVLTLSDGTTLSFDGFCLEFSIAGGVDALVSASCTIEITGPVTWVEVIPGT